MTQGEVRSARHRWLVGLAIVALLAASCGREDAWPKVQGVSVSADSFPGEPWAKDLLREQVDGALLRKDDRYGWRFEDSYGRYHNMRRSMRASLVVAEPTVTIWFFGGSTMQGIGQRDDHTLPSEIVRLAKESGHRVRVRNYGVSAWVNTQESALFADLVEGGERPDIAVFLDGTNDFGLGFERVRFGELDPSEDVRMMVDGDRQRARAEELEAQGYEQPSDPDLPYELAAQQYRRGVLAARSVAAEHGIDLVTFWQPQLISVTGGRPYLPEVPKRANISPRSISTGPEAVRRVAEMSGVEPVDLSGAFDGIDDPLFFDGAHTNERGARILAAAMWAHLEPLVAKADAES